MENLFSMKLLDCVCVQRFVVNFCETDSKKKIVKKYFRNYAIGLFLYFSQQSVARNNKTKVLISKKKIIKIENQRPTGNVDTLMLENVFNIKINDFSEIIL